MSAAAEVVAKSANKEEGLIRHQDLKYGKKLGQGGFGVVYQGTWRMVDIAIKELIPEKLTTESAKSLKPKHKP
jgi:predicted Ser/Thr protein kinase